MIISHRNGSKGVVLQELDPAETGERRYAVEIVEANAWHKKGDIVIWKV